MSLNDWKLTMSLIGGVCFLFAGVQLYFGKSITNLGRVFERETNPEGFWWNVLFSLACGIVAISLLLWVSLSAPSE
jgi:H+/Cl- antiporter ClcA